MDLKTLVFCGLVARRRQMHSPSFHNSAWLCDAKLWWCGVVGRQLYGWTTTSHGLIEIETTHQREEIYCQGLVFICLL